MILSDWLRDNEINIVAYGKLNDLKICSEQSCGGSRQVSDRLSTCRLQHMVQVVTKWHIMPDYPLDLPFTNHAALIQDFEHPTRRIQKHGDMFPAKLIA